MLWCNKQLIYSRSIRTHIVNYLLNVIYDANESNFLYKQANLCSILRKWFEFIVRTTLLFCCGCVKKCSTQFDYNAHPSQFVMIFFFKE